MEGLLCDFGLLFAVLPLGFGNWELGILGLHLLAWGLGRFRIWGLGFGEFGVWDLG